MLLLLIRSAFWPGDKKASFQVSDKLTFTLGKEAKWPMKFPSADRINICSTHDWHEFSSSGVCSEWSLAFSLILPLNSNGFRWKLPPRLLKRLDSAYWMYHKKYSSKHAQSLKSRVKGEFEKWNIHKNTYWIATSNQTMRALWQINLCNDSVATEALNRKLKILCAFMLGNIFFYLYYNSSFHILKKYTNKLLSDILGLFCPRISFIVL